MTGICLKLHRDFKNYYEPNYDYPYIAKRIKDKDKGIQLGWLVGCIGV